MVRNLDRNMSQLLNKTNVNNWIALFDVSVMIMTRVSQIMTHNMMQKLS
jgi:hypothetical protein